MTSLQKNYLKQVGIALFWGSGFIAGNFVGQAMPPLTAAFFRFLIAAIVLLVIGLIKKDKLPRLSKRELFFILMMALFGMAIYNYCFFVGLKTVEASVSSMIIALNPVIVAIISAVIFKEKLKATQYIGIILSAFGAIFIVSRGNPLLLFSIGLTEGELYIFACLISWVIYIFMSQEALRTVKPIHAVSWGCIFAVAMLAIPAYLESGFSWQVLSGAGLKAWISIFVLGAICTAIAFTWYYQSIDMIGASLSGVFYNLVPLFSIIMAVIILDERPGLSFAIGAIIVIGGVLLANYKKKSEARRQR